MNKVAESVVKEREWIASSESLKQFDGILSKFERKFGAKNVRWQLSEYANRIGIALLHDSGRRLGILFRKNGDEAQVTAALELARKWMENPTCPPGVEDGWTLEGAEVAAWLLADGKVV